MKKLIEKIKAKFRRKPLLVIPDVNGSASLESDKHMKQLFKAWNAGARNGYFRDSKLRQTFEEWYSEHYS